MSRAFLAGLAAVLALAAPAAAETVLYRNATLIDGTGAPPRPGVSVLVTDERIAAVGADVAAPEGARVVDLSGKYLLPGLIDAHQHLATPPDRRRAEATLRRDLYGGVTAVRDMADDLRAVAELARAARKGEIPAPDIHFAALMAGPSFFDDPRTLAVSYGFKPGTTPWMQAIDGTTDLREAVTLARGTGATAIKIYANLPADLVAKIAAEAHRQEMQVWAHAAVYPATPAEVIAARPDVISHACSLAHQALGTPQTYQSRTPMDGARFLGADDPVIALLLEQMKARRIILDATTSIYAHYDALAAANPKLKKPLCSGPMSAALTRQAWRAGVAIAAGTDWVAPHDDPWPTLHHELHALAASGMPPLEVIRAATETAARAAGAGDEMGVVAPGKLANLIVTTADPSTDIENLKTLEGVVKRGREYSRADFAPLTKADLEDRP